MTRFLFIIGGWLAMLTLHAENILSLSSVQGSPEEEVTVELSLSNTDAVTAIQVSIPLDQQLTLVEGSATLTSRASSHQATVGTKDGVLNIVVYSLSMAALSGSEGDVVTFRLKLGKEPGDIVLDPSKTIITLTDGTAAEASVVSGTVSIRSAKAQYSSITIDYGRVPILSNYQQTLTISNVGNEPLTVTGMLFSDPVVFSCTESFPFSVAAGTSRTIALSFAPTERGNVNETVKVECNSSSKLNTIALKATPYAVNELHVQPATGVSDEEVTIHLTVNNMDDITGFQFEFNLPDKLKYVDGSFALSDRKADHSLMATLNGTILRAIAYSSTNTPFNGNDGDIATFRVRLDGQSGATLEAQKAILTAQIKNVTTDVLSDKFGAYITIQSPNISTASNINMGRVPVTEECRKSFTIRNSGNAPLSISRILFDNEALSIEDGLPVMITAGRSKSFTIVYNSLEETEFSSTMRIYNNDPEKRLVTVTVTGSRFAPNTLYVNTEDVLVCDDLKVDVSLNNYDELTGVQFDVVLPTVTSGNKTIPVYQMKEGGVVLTPRTEGMSVTQRQIDATTVRCFCYFLNQHAISSGDGKILSLAFEPLPALTEGTYIVSIQNIILGTSELTNKYSGESTVFSSFNVEGFMLGDADNDHVVDVADIVIVANYILSNGSTTIFFYNADVDGDGIIDVADIVGIANIILNQGHHNLRPRIIGNNIEPQ